MRRPLPVAKIIQPADIETGDLITASWHIGDMKHSRTGRVDRILHDGPLGTTHTADGQELCRWLPGTNTQVSIVLLERAAEKNEVLDLFDNELEIRLNG